MEEEESQLVSVLCGAFRVTWEEKRKSVLVCCGVWSAVCWEELVLSALMFLQKSSWTDCDFWRDEVHFGNDTLMCLRVSGWVLSFGAGCWGEVDTSVVVLL